MEDGWNVKDKDEVEEATESTTLCDSFWTNRPDVRLGIFNLDKLSSVVVSIVSKVLLSNFSILIFCIKMECETRL